jgi:hypothetical protein
MGIIEWVKKYKVATSFVGGIVFVLFLGMTGLPTYIGYGDSAGHEAKLINTSQGYGIPIYLLNANLSGGGSDINNNIFVINGNVLVNTSGDQYLYQPNNASIRFNNTKLDLRINSLISSAGLIEGVTAGTGLLGGGSTGVVTLTANTTYLQRRVGSTCAAGSSIRVINQDGTVTCETGSSNSGTVTDIYTSMGLTGGHITTSGTIGVNYSVIVNKTFLTSQGYLTSINYGVVANKTWVNSRGFITNLIGSTGITPVAIVNGTILRLNYSIVANKTYVTSLGYLTNAVKWIKFGNGINIQNISNTGIVGLNFSIVVNKTYLASLGYLTTYTETDPVFGLSAAKNIVAGNITNWNTAYSWGNHATAGYLKSINYSIVANKTWVTSQGYLIAEVDGSVSNEIQNIITNKGLQRDGSNNFGLINCGNSQILVYNTTTNAWACKNQATGSGGGSVSSITARTGLTGGTITTTGTIALNQTYTEKLAHRTPSAVLFDYDGDELSNITNVYSDRNVTTLFTYNNSNSQLMNIYKIDSVLGNKNITFVYNGTTLMEVVYS